MHRTKTVRLTTHVLAMTLLAAAFGIGSSTWAVSVDHYETPPSGKISAANKKRLTPLVERIAKQYGVEAALLDALISAESGYDPKAVSVDGAIGLMQLLPVTAKHYGVEDAGALFDPEVNVTVGTRHLKVLLKKYRNISHALAAYNAGEGAVDTQRRRITYLESRKFVVRAIKYYWQHKARDKPIASGLVSVPAVQIR